tara:strand:+ start:184 stop:360 length:177 start_codon:yes stop_codon:yes gene_type:complete
MKKFEKKNKEIILWFTWLFLIIIWNFGYPKANPSEDVLVAIIISLIIIFLKKQKNKHK